MDISNTHHYYGHSAPRFIQETFLSLSLYTFDNISCIYLLFEIDHIKNKNHDIYSKINKKIYERLIKHFNRNTITFCDKSNILIMYLYDTSKKDLEHKYLEFYEYIHNISIPIHEKEYKIFIKAGMTYSKYIKDPIFLLDNAYKQYLNLNNHKTFISFIDLNNEIHK